jgi:CMP-N-acetylneuraminic acid synthetase
MFTVIVPARGGSKGIPHKNLKQVGGVSLLNRAINSALAVESVSQVIVTSDSEVILNSAIADNRVVLSLRNTALASDEADIRETVASLIPIVKCDSIILLQPTSPLRSGRDVRAAIANFSESNCDSLVSVCEAEHPKNYYLMEDLEHPEGLREVFPEVLSTLRRQDAPRLYRLNGAIYIFSKSDFAAYGTFNHGNTYYYQMSKLNSIDIDDPVDLELANLIIQNKGALCDQ